MVCIEDLKNSISKALINSWLWRFTGCVSSIVGFTCYALSPTFQYMFGQWSLLKIILYSMVSSLSFVFMLFMERCSKGRGSSLLLKAQVGFVVLMLTSLWSLFEDRSEQGKVENGHGKMMNLISTGAFALMAMSFSRQLELGFEVGVTNFLIGCFLVTLMKMSLTLAPLAALLCYLFINIRSISDFLRSTQHADNTVEENLQYPLTNSGIFSDGSSRESVVQDTDFVELEANSDVSAHDTDLANFVDLEANAGLPHRPTYYEFVTDDNTTVSIFRDKGRVQLRVRFVEIAKHSDEEDFVNMEQNTDSSPELQPLLHTREADENNTAFDKKVDDPINRFREQQTLQRLDTLRLRHPSPALLGVEGD